VVPLGPGRRAAGGAGARRPRLRSRGRSRPSAGGGPRGEAAQVGRARGLRGPRRGEDYAAVAARLPHRNSPALSPLPSVRLLFSGLSLRDWRGSGWGNFRSFQLSKYGIREI
jgi:hypothetical protein